MHLGQMVKDIMPGFQTGGAEREGGRVTSLESLPYQSWGHHGGAHKGSLSRGLTPRSYWECDHTLGKRDRKKVCECVQKDSGYTHDSVLGVTSRMLCMHLKIISARDWEGVSTLHNPTSLPHTMP